MGFYHAFLDLLRDPLSQFKPFWDVFYRDFVPDKYPMSGPIQIAYILGFPTCSQTAGSNSNLEPPPPVRTSDRYELASFTR